MIISNDLKSIYIGSPKSGTRTAKSLLENYGTFLGDHLTPTAALSAASRKINNFDYQTVENFYVFWRDPVEKFISGVNFLRGNRPSAILLKNPDWFPQFDYSSLITTTESGIQIIDESGITQEMKDAVVAITPEQLFDWHVYAKQNNPSKSYMVLEKQSAWIWKGNTTILNYSDFDNNMRIVMNIFGVPSDVTIPVLNESVKITTSISSQLQSRIMQYYAEDYDLI